MRTMNLTPEMMENVCQGRAVLAYVLNFGTPDQEELHAGIVTAITTEGNDESTDVWFPNGEYRVQVGELPGPRSFMFKFTTQSITSDVRVDAVMGLKREGGLPAVVNFSLTVSTPVPGRRVDLGRPTDNVKIANMVEGEHFVVIENREVVLFKSVPAGAPATVDIKGSQAAMPGAVVADVGRQSRRDVRLILRGVEADKPGYRLEIPRGLQRLTGEFGYIGENDPIEAEYEVKVLADQAGSFGKLTVYPAKPQA